MGNPQQAATSAIGNILAARVAAAATAAAPRPAAQIQPIAAPRATVSQAAAAPAILTPGQLTPADLAQRFRSAVTRARAAVWELVWTAHQLDSTAGWEALGYATPDDFAHAEGIAPSTLAGYISLGARLNHLTLAEMQNLSLGALNNLARVHPTVWPEFAWVEEAKALPAREFSMLVAQRNKNYQARPLAEPRTAVAITIPQSQQLIITRRIDHIRKGARLATAGDALIHALAETDRAASLTDSLAIISSNVAELARLWSADEPWVAGLSAAGETEEETAARHTLGRDSSGPITSLSAAAARTQTIVRQMAKLLAKVKIKTPPMEEGASSPHAQIPTEAIQPSAPASTGSEQPIPHPEIL